MINFSIKELAHAVRLLDSSLVRIFVEMKGLTCQQLAEESGKEEDLTLHSPNMDTVSTHFSNH